MAGISQHCKTGDVPAFGECVGVASKALCGLTEAAGQVSLQAAPAQQANMVIQSSKIIKTAVQLHFPCLRQFL